MAITVSNLRTYSPATPAGPASVRFDVTSTTGAYSAALSQGGTSVNSTSGAAPAAVTMLSTVGALTLTVTDLAVSGQTLTFALAVPAYPGPPTVESQPAAVTAAHLPMLATLRADPASTTPAVVLAVVEVLRGTWQEVGKLREVCDAAGYARFDVSEFVKTQFSETPPNESGGPDPALGIQWRVRYGRAEVFSGDPGTEAGTYGGLAVNAAEVVNPALLPYPLALGPDAPYLSVPTGAARFRTRVNAAADGVINAPVTPVNGSDWPCPVRQFVWLHPSGAWCWGFFAGRHQPADETGDGTVVRRANGVRRYVSRGDVSEVVNVYSDVLDWPTYQVLRTVRTSVQAYERLASGLYVPVLIEAGSYPPYKETDKIFRVDFTARYPVQVRQTQ